MILSKAVHKQLLLRYTWLVPLREGKLRVSTVLTISGSIRGTPIIDQKGIISVCLETTAPLVITIKVRGLAAQPSEGSQLAQPLSAIITDSHLLIRSHKRREPRRAPRDQD